MNERVEALRRESLAATPSISAERACLLTGFYREHEARLSAPMLRAEAFAHLCRHKTIHIGDGELIVGERGPAPGVVPTFPELICHSERDLESLDVRPAADQCRQDL